MTRSFCIFCKSSLNDSDEHIIPQSVNGTLHSTRLICHDCNSNFFGRYIDPILKKLLNPLLLLLGWDNASSMQAEDIDGDRYVIRKSADIQPLQPIKEEEVFGNRIRISVKGDPKNTLKMFQKAALKLKDQGKILVDYKVSEVNDSSPFIRAKWEIEINVELTLLMNKIALEFHAFNELDYAPIEELCKRVRAHDNFIDNIVFCNQKNEIRDFDSDEVSHLILIQNDKEAGILFAYVEIFNLICCTLILSKDYREKDVSIQYHQDALTGERFTAPVKMKMNIEDILAYNFSHDNFQYLNNSLSYRLRSREFRMVLKEQLKLLSEELKEKERNGEIREADFEQAYIEQSTELIAYLTVYHFPYILEDQNDEENDDYNYIHSNFRKEIVDDFCKEHSQLLGKKLQTKEGIFTIIDFYEQPHIVKKDKELITLYFVLANDETGDKKYIKIKTIIDMVVEAIKQRQAGAASNE